MHNSVRPMIVMRRRRRPFSPHGESGDENRRANVTGLEVVRAISDRQLTRRRYRLSLAI